MISCKYCDRQYEYKRNSGHTKKVCNSCLVNRRRFKLKKRIIVYMGGKCVRCGYDGCLGALHPHHLDPLEKDFNISGCHSRSWEAIERELNKCILLCSNCHFEEHHGCENYGCKPSKGRN